MTNHDLQNLIELAFSTAERAYTPYSNYKVGATLRTPDGTVFSGCNVENAAYPACICAERTALVKAVSEGHQQFDVIVVATRNGGSPCGMCRQMLYEFSPTMRVVCVDEQRNIVIDSTLDKLLPHGFNSLG
ncbi:MAG: cytidine deaminase [Aggregatilineales bacterium]